jgi:uncharacterized protein
MMRTSKDHPALVLDADSHVLEPRDTWIRFMDPASRDLALTIVDHDHEWNGVKGKRSALCWREGALFDVAGFVPVGSEGSTSCNNDGQPISTAQMEDLASIRELLIPYEEQGPAAASDPAERLKWMNAKHIDASILFPTWGLMWERYLFHDPSATCANMRAYNRWIVEFCSTDPKRLLPVGQITLLDLVWAEAELHSLARMGVKVCMIRPVLTQGKPLGHDDFDRIWTVAESLGVKIAFHISAYGNGSRGFFDDGWSVGELQGPANGITQGVTPHVPVMLTLTSMLRFGVFARHPRLKCAVLECSTGWVRPWLDLCRAVFRASKLRQPELAKRCPEDPAQYIGRQVWFGAFEYEDLASTIRDIGSDKVLFSSDFPHPESNDDPIAAFVISAEALDRETTDRMFYKNASAFLDA